MAELVKILVFSSLALVLAACTASSNNPHSGIRGAFFGTFYGEASPSLALYEAIGKMPAISAQYLGWSDGFPGVFASAHAQLGRITLITWEYNPRPGERYQNRTLDAITDGIYDEYLASWAEAAAAFGKSVLVRWGHEMNGDWYLWGGVHNGGGHTAGYGAPDLPDGPERYIAAFRYIHDLFLERGADNVLWVWCPCAPFHQMDTAHESTGWNRAENYYPGDDYVDWLCFDGYNWGSSSIGQQLNSQWKSFDDIFRESYQRLRRISRDKPIMIGEFSSTEEGGDKAAWVKDALSKIENEYPQIKAIIWFHIAKETDWRIDSSASSLESFRTALEGNEYWHSTWPAMADIKENNNE